MIDWYCGPANMFIDATLRCFTDHQLEYDEDAEWARPGNVDQEVVNQTNSWTTILISITRHQG